MDVTLEAKSVAGNGSLPSILKKKGDRPALPLSQILLNGSIVPVTPELAHRIQLECFYERQRRVRPLHSQALAMQIKNKEFTPGTQLHFARMVSDGWLRLVNGYHRLDAVKDANRTVEFQILITDCNSEQDVARLYRRHDRLVVPRTVIDMLKAEDLPRRHGLSVTLSRTVFRAALIIHSGFAFSGRQAKADPYTYRSDEARLELCKPWWVIAEHYSECIAAGDSRLRGHLETAAGPMAVALVTLRDQEVKADAFWRGLANNDGLRRDDPRAAYIRFYHVRNNARGAFLQAKAASLAWSAFYADKGLAFVRPGDTPIKIAGCELE